MKKLVLAFVLVAAVMGTAAAQSEESMESVDLTPAASQINLGNFPIGSWLDTKWNATWTFEGNDIKLYQGGTLIYSFNGKIKDFKVSAAADGVTLSFSCDETGRSYKFFKDLSLTTDIDMTIDRNDVPAADPNKHYEVRMKRR
ncbi:MAG: hypothetical protein IJ191_01630 [Treponema sp.]|nr:hypothetical protein [Treponema sp.]